jgi:mRNA-degrading endonuclease toxin of MazEF toxin-antitoxin module
VRNDDLDQRRRQLGLAPVALQALAKPGAVFVIDLMTTGGQIIRFPEGELKQSQTEHETRRVIVVQNTLHSQRADPRSILVVPCSGSHVGPVPSWDLQIPDDEPAFSKKGVVAYPSLVQPILKSRLLTHMGDLSPECLIELQARLAMILGLADPEPLPIPPR